MDDDVMILSKGTGVHRADAIPTALSSATCIFRQKMLRERNREMSMFI